MPTDPTDPSSPNPSTRPDPTTPDAPRGSGGGIFFVILLLVLLGGGAAYYFVVVKPGAGGAGIATVTPTPKPATPTPVKASPTPDTSYGNAQREQYNKQASNAFIALRDAKLQPFTEAFNALIAAGGVSATGLTTKEAIAARRDLINKCSVANDDYEAFVKTQEAAFKAELQKTPLTPDDVAYIYDDYVYKAQTAKNIQLRDLRRDSLKSGDEMMAYLDKTFGGWSVNAAQHLVFKKPADSNGFVAIQKQYNEQVEAMTKLRDELKGPDAGTATAGSPATSPAVSPATGSPVASPTAAPSVAPAATVTP